MGPCPALPSREPRRHRGARRSRQGKPFDLTYDVCIMTLAGASFADGACFQQPRPSSLSTRSARSSRPNKSKSSSFPSQSDSPRQIGSHPRFPDVAFSQLHTRKFLLPSRSSSVNSLACLSTMRPPWSDVKPRPTSPSLSRRCRLPLSSTK